MTTLHTYTCYFKNLLTHAQQIQFRKWVKDNISSLKTAQHKNNTRVFNSLFRFAFSEEPTESEQELLYNKAKEFDEQTVCQLCRGIHNKTKEIWVGDSDPPVPPNGVMTLEAKYRAHNICTHCLATLERQIVEQGRQQPHGSWITWEEDGRHYAHCPARAITWELLPSGRPKKMEAALLPPYLRGPGVEGLTKPNDRYPYNGENDENT